MTKKEKNNVVCNKKVCFLGGTILLLVAVIGALLFKGYKFDAAKANADYICIKNVSNGVCYPKTCNEWKGDGTRDCTGVKYLQTYYYSVRVGCQDGGEGSIVGSNNGASGRRTNDMVYTEGESESCYYIEYDHVPPSWDGV